MFSGCLTSHHKYHSVSPAILKRITYLRKCVFDRYRKEMEKLRLKQPFKSPDVDASSPTRAGRDAGTCWDSSEVSLRVKTDFRMRLIFVIVSAGGGGGRGRFVFFYFFHFLSFHYGVCLISILSIVKFSCKATCFMTTKLKFFNW